MQRKPINHVSWADKLGFDQGFDNSGGRFVTTVLGITRLFAPSLLVLLEATAVD